MSADYPDAKCSVCFQFFDADQGNGYDRCESCPPKCPPGCKGFEIARGTGDFSGCECLGWDCDCPNHPKEPTP